ncbi:coniferyl aldehyde dehydrogenase [Aliikangiella marina]|uniref:Aldehyde dehydrogenase n=1 Tax=Aliikangiella marina TaxID=1712262 RepID=A0A545T4G7_9GAMM|nr:coniferyl aldehyde dehydrogenase [Aliikangiella marina]TQV72109.1 coniferyl aldehyde dehydrogenase [Aliikangiella marina]
MHTTNQASAVNSDNTENNQTIDHTKHQIQNAREVFDLQRATFAQAPFPGEKLRLQQLKALKTALLKHKDKLVKAISADFDCRSNDESLLADVLPTIMNIDHAMKHLRAWMKPEKRKIHWLFQPAKAGIMYQPLGVVGIMGAWNYPVFLTLGPLVAAIAAGNRAMVKPSEHCPYTNRVLNEIIQESFTQDEVYLVEGGVEVGAAFTELPFDHILFTGSTKVGRLVMSAAAKNLTPVTLELGGKSPAIIASDVSADFAVERMLFGKTLNAGQTCVAPDYVLCPEDKVDGLIEAFKDQFSVLYPDVNNGDRTSIINEGQHSRLSDWLKDAQDKGANIIPLSEENPKVKRYMPLYLATDVSMDMTIMQEEIFGPILPIVTYKNIEQAIQIVNDGARPLALYLFSFDKALQQKLALETHSGGICVNDTLVHFAQDDLPIGGVGPSGMGKYHAQEGFKTFSNAKPIFKRGRFNSAKMAFPPYGNAIHRFIYRWFLR